MLRFYALCCRNMHALKRHLRHIPKDQLTIVINTLDQGFQTEAVAFCQAEGVDYAVTESNGTASQGKNSVIDLFLASSDDYFVLVDGDDYLTPHGVWTYQQIAQLESPPDVLALEYQYAIWRENGYGFSFVEHLMQGSEQIDRTNLSNPYLGCQDKSDPDKIMGHGTRGFLQSHEWWKLAKQGDVVHVHPGESFSQRLCDAHQRWVNLAYKYISHWETHHRIVFFSRRSCDGYRYDTDFAVGEDTILYLLYKNAHIKGDLVVKHLFDRYPTYVYDTRIDGVVFENQWKDGIVNLGWCEWLENLSARFEQMETDGKMHESVEMPKINDEIVWPENYVPDTLGAANYPGVNTIIYP